MVRQACWLARHGVPFDTAMDMSPTFSFALSVIVSEQGGGQTFNWKTGEFVEAK